MQDEPIDLSVLNMSHNAPWTKALVLRALSIVSKIKTLFK